MNEQIEHLQFKVAQFCNETGFMNMDEFINCDVNDIVKISKTYSFACWKLGSALKDFGAKARDAFKIKKNR